MTKYDYDKMDPHFIEDLAKSQEAVQLVADWLSGFGYKVTIPPIEVRPDPSVMSDYSDNGDIKVEMTVEVKRRGFNFTGADDYPYPTAIVDNCLAFDRKTPMPHSYVLLSNDMKAALIVLCSTKKFWQRVERLDRAKSRVRRMYEVELKHGTFVRF